MKWVSTIPSGGGGSSAIWPLPLVRSHTGFTTESAADASTSKHSISFGCRVAVRTAGGGRGCAIPHPRHRLGTHPGPQITSPCGGAKEVPARTSVGVIDDHYLSGTQRPRRDRLHA
jgi:hypothetical protein